MKSDEKLWEICMKIYKEAFARADPPADFDKLVKSGEVKQPHFFMKYYLPETIADEIVKKYSMGLSKYEKQRISETVYLGCLPTSVRENWYTREQVEKRG